MKFTLKILASIILAVSVAACGGGSGSTPSTNTGGQVTTLSKTDTVIGTGAEATASKQVTVQYTGWLYDANASAYHGAKFDSSVDRGTPFSFTLGAGQVISGWDQGVLGMKVGGKRTLIIPSSMGYGAQGNGAIPGNAALVFDIELLSVK